MDSNLQKESKLRKPAGKMKQETPLPLRWIDQLSNVDAADSLPNALRNG